MARAALDSVGLPGAGEWTEWTGFAFHVRRRLTEDEGSRVGPVIDVRGTQEGHRRQQSVMRWLPADWELEV